MATRFFRKSLRRANERRRKAIFALKRNRAAAQKHRAARKDRGEVQLAVFVSREIRDRLRAYASEKGLTLSVAVEQLISIALKR